jgi:hypothetical protein
MCWVSTSNGFHTITDAAESMWKKEWWFPAPNNRTVERFCSLFLVFIFGFWKELDGCIVEFSQMGIHNGGFWRCCFFFCFSNGMIHNRMLQHHVGCWRRMQCNWKNRIQNLWGSPKKKKDQNFAFILDKTNSEAHWNELFQNHVQQKFREKKKKKNTKNNKTTKEDCGSHQDWSSFELLTLKLTKSPQNGCWGPGISIKQTRWPKTNPINGTSFHWVMGWSIEQW